MAQLNITLNQDEILQLLANDRDAAFAKLLQDSLNSILKVESAAQLKAEPYERTEERTGSRNGYRERPLTTRIGNITLSVPKHRDGEPFHTMVFDNYDRSEAALVVTMAEMVVNGVSTRKVSQVMETLCGKTYSKSTVSEACKELDKKGGILIGKTQRTWNEFMKSLKNRGLYGLKMIISDAHEGIQDAVSKVFPEAAWQRCQFHFSRNIIDKVSKKYQAGLSAELQEMFNCKTIKEARKLKDTIIAYYKDVAEEAMNCLDEGFENAMTVMVLPYYLRKYFRTSNHVERLNRELKRRSKVIGIFPNEASLMRLMGSVLVERNEQLIARKCIFSNKTYQELLSTDVPAKFIQIATDQRNLLAS